MKTTKLTKTQIELAKHIDEYGYVALHIRRVKSALTTARNMYMKQHFSYLACGMWVVIAKTSEAARTGFDITKETYKVLGLK